MNDVSQFGETQILVKEILNDASKYKIVVDAGARGKARSNSYDLMRHFGWRGLLIEANPTLVASIRREFAGLDFELINCAVSDYTGSASFHIGIRDGVSSLSEHAAKRWGPTRGSVEIKVERLGEILKSRNIPLDFDVLSLDIEGEDIKVFNQIVDNYAYRPRWVIIEASFDFRVKTLDDIHLSPEIRKNYAIVGQTRANLILKYLTQMSSAR
jgi:FkbM family methyltransferase